MASKKLKVQVGLDFTSDQMSIEKIGKQIDKAVSAVKINLDPQSAKKFEAELRELGGLLQKHLNPNTGKIDAKNFVADLDNRDIFPMIEKLGQRYSEIGVNGQQSFRTVANEADFLNKKIGSSNKTLEKMGTTLMNTIRWNISSSVVNAVTGEFQKMYYFAKDLDRTLTDIRIVSGQSADQMERFAIHANESAKALGVGTIEYAQAATLFYQQGLGDADVKKMTDGAVMASRITGIAAADMADLLTSTMNGYKLAADEVMTVTDKLAAVGATTAADFNELATGMSKVASMANTAGVSIDELNAQIATIVSVTRESPESIGTSLKTIYGRMLMFKTDTKALMEDDDGEVFGAPKVEEALQAYNKVAGAQISLFKTSADGSRELRDLGEVIEEVGNSWDTVTDKTAKFGLATALAGSRQQNRLVALFDSWDMYQEAVVTSLNAEGTTLEQNAKYMDSYEGKIKGLQAAKEDMYMTLTDPDSMKFFVGALTEGVQLFTKLVDMAGGFSAVLGIIGVAFSDNLVKKAYEFQQSFVLPKEMKETGKEDEQIDSMKELHAISKAFGADEANRYREDLRNKKAALKEMTVEKHLLEQKVTLLEDIAEDAEGDYSEAKKKALIDSLIAEADANGVAVEGAEELRVKYNELAEAQQKLIELKKLPGDQTRQEVEDAKAVADELESQIKSMHKKAVEAAKHGKEAHEEMEEQVKKTSAGISAKAKETERLTIATQATRAAFMLLPAAIGGATDSSKSLNEVLKSIVMLSLPSIASALKPVIASFGVAKDAAGAFSATMLISPGIIAGITLVTMALAAITKAAVEAKNKAKELLNEQKELTRSFRESENWIKTNTDRYKELSKGVDDYGRNLTLTNEEYSEYKGIVQELVGMSPAIVQGYTNEGDAIIDKNTALEETVKLLEKERELEIAKATTSSNLTALGKGAQAEKQELEGIYGQFKPNLETVEGQAQRFAEEAAEVFDAEATEAFAKYIGYAAYEYDIASGTNFQEIGETLFSLNIDEFAQNADEIFKLADIDPFSEAAIGLKLYAQEWQTLNHELEQIDFMYIDEALQLIPLLEEGYGDLEFDSSKSFISDFIRNSFSSFELEQDANKVKTEIIALVQDIVNDKELQEIIEELNLLEINKDDLSASDYYQQYQDLIDKIVKKLNVSDAKKSKIKAELEIEISDTQNLKQNLADEINKLGLKDIQYMLTDTGLEGFIEGLSVEDLKLFYEIVVSDDSDYVSFKGLLDGFKEAKDSLKEDDTIKLEVLLGEDSEFNKSVDEYQSKISTLKTALGAIKAEGKLDSSALTDLIQQFPELSGHTDDLEAGITNLIKSFTTKELNKFDKELKNLGTAQEQEQLKAVKEIIKGIGEEAIDTTGSTSTLSDAIDGLSSFAGDMKALDTAYAKIAEGKKIDSSDIVALHGAFGQTANFDKFISTINDMNKITPQVQQAFNNLTTEFVHTSRVLDDLTDENIDFIVAQLELEGVTNANVIATERLALQKEYLAATGKNLADATFDEVVEFARLETTSDNTRIAIANLAQQKINANNIALMVDGDIKSLRNLMAALGATTNALSLYNTVKSRGYVPGMPSSDYSKYLKSLMSSAQSEVDAFFNSLNGRNSNSSRTAYASPTAKKNAGKNQKQKQGREDNTDYHLEAFERELTELQYKRDKDIISEKQYLDSLNKLNNQYFKGKSKYLDKYRQYEVEVYQGLKKLEEQRLSDIQSKYDDRLSVIQNTQEEIQHQIDLLESKDAIVGVGFYNQLISNAKEQINLLNQEKNAIQSLFNSQLSSGFIKSGTDEYYDFIQALNGIDSQIRDLILQTVNWGKTLEEEVVKVFDNLIDNIEHLNSELSTLYDLLGNKKLTDEVGFTKEGIASIGLLAQQIEASQFKIKEYSDEIERLSENYAENEERIEELKEAQWDEVRTTQSLRDAIVDLNKERVKSIEEGLKKEYDAYQKIIQAKKDALDSEKNLHDYQNSIAEKEKDVISLRKQLVTLELDDSDEARTRSALLREELAKAEKALEEEQYKHSIDKQKEALDKELEDYQAQIDEKMMTLEEYLENENQVIADSLELAKKNASAVASVIADLAIEHGIEVSNAVVNPWLQGTNAIASYGDALSSLTSKFTAELSKMADEMDRLLKQANNASKVTVPTPKPAPTPAPKPAPKPAPAKPSSSSSSSSSNKKSLPLATVKYTGNKSKLNKETSIVDRLKSHDLDSSTGARAKLYNHFGGAGFYDPKKGGTSSQNQFLIKKLKEIGFKKGGEIGDLINKTGEHGFILARKGESVITEDATNLLKTSLPKLDNLFSNLTKLTNKIPSVNNKSNQPVINLNYDNLINVEGNIDKDFTQEFSKLSEQTYNKIASKLYQYGQRLL